MLVAMPHQTKMNGSWLIVVSHKLLKSDHMNYAKDDRTLGAGRTKTHDTGIRLRQVAHLIRILGICSIFKIKTVLADSNNHEYVILWRDGGVGIFPN